MYYTCHCRPLFPLSCTEIECSEIRIGGDDDDEDLDLPRELFPFRSAVEISVIEIRIETVSEKRNVKDWRR